MCLFPESHSNFQNCDSVELCAVPPKPANYTRLLLLLNSSRLFDGVANRRSSGPSSNPQLSPRPISPCYFRLRIIFDPTKKLNSSTSANFAWAIHHLTFQVGLRVWLLRILFHPSELLETFPHRQSHRNLTTVRAHEVRASITNEPFPSRLSMFCHGLQIGPAIHGTLLTDDRTLCPFARPSLDN
jgi:hypothetical protein